MLCQIAGALAQAGEGARAALMLDKAVAIAEGMENEVYKASALGYIAKELAQAGEKTRAALILDKAVTTAERIKNERYKTETLGYIAKELAQVGAFDRAVTTAERIENKRYNAEALGYIAKKLAQAGAFDRAVTTSERIEDARYKAEALGQIADALAHINEAADRRRILCRVLESAYQSGRSMIWSILGAAAPVLASMDGGLTLQKISEGIMEVEEWWDSGAREK
jgi:tetratricopeptide (TPR) repeat protein